MGTLETIMQLRNQGKTDSQITEDLKQQGLAPKEIDESLSQSKIKSALSDQDVMLQQPSQASQPIQPPQATSELKTGSAPMQPSIMQQTPGTYPEVQQPAKPTQPIQELSSFQPSTTPTQEPPQPESYKNQDYQYPEYAPETSIETINEIAEQILDEKTAQLKNQITSFTRFKEEIASEVLKLSERLSRIENTLNELQVAILRKIGDYGKDIKNIAKEMHSTQDSFSKILNPLTDNIREMQKITGTTPESQPSRPKPKTKSSKSKSGKKSKQKPSFEDYLR